METCPQKGCFSKERPVPSTRDCRLIGLLRAFTLKITGGEWDAFVDDFQQTLDKFVVPAQEQAELKAIVDSTRANIVVEPEAATTS
jgi:hypothetical protein